MHAQSGYNVRTLLLKKILGSIDLFMQWPPLPDYGCILRWPEDGQAFIHPEDVAVATRCFPSGRVLRREAFDGVYYHYSYGALRFRLRPMMWLPVRSEGFDVGDTVETTGVGFERELFVAQVWGMHYVPRKGCILYRLRRRDTNVPNLFHADQIRLLSDKSKVRDGDIGYPEPKWNGDQTDRLEGVEL